MEGLGQLQLCNERERGAEGKADACLVSTKACKAVAVIKMKRKKQNLIDTTEIQQTHTCYTSSVALKPTPAKLQPSLWEGREKDRLPQLLLNNPFPGDCLRGGILQ
jgi:hypothetical protein